MPCSRSLRNPRGGGPSPSLATVDEQPRHTRVGLYPGPRLTMRPRMRSPVSEIRFTIGQSDRLDRRSAWPASGPYLAAGASAARRPPRRLAPPTTPGNAHSRCSNQSLHAGSASMVSAKIADLGWHRLVSHASANRSSAPPAMARTTRKRKQGMPPMHYVVQFNTICYLALARVIGLRPAGECVRCLHSPVPQDPRCGDGARSNVEPLWGVLGSTSPSLTGNAPGMWCI